MLWLRASHAARYQVATCVLLRTRIPAMQFRLLRVSTKVVSGFRIVIFSDNGQYAGDNAQAELESFRSKFPHLNAYLVYESPYFKVSVGDCLSMEEAQILMAQLTPHYPKAFPKRENIRFEELYDARREVRDTLLTTPVEVIFEEN